MDQKEFEKLIKKVEEQKKTGVIDLSMEEDLAIGVMNLISLEEHFFFTGAKTGKEEYFDLLQEVRNARKELLGKLIDKHEGETWCIAKHLLAATMRFIEVGTKLRQDGKSNEAKEVFLQANKMFTLFWALRLKLVDVSGVRQQAEKEQPWTLKDIVNKLVDCCDE